MPLVSYGMVHQDAAVDNKGIRRYIEVYQVITDALNEDPATVSAYVPGNTFTTVYANDVLARLKKKTPYQGDVNSQGGHVWEVTLEYDSEVDFVDAGTVGASGAAPAGSPGGAASSVAPNLRPAQLTIDSIEVRELRTKDFDDAAITNSAGAPFVPPLEVSVYHPLLTITNFKSIGSETYDNTVTYTGKVNLGAWWGRDAGTALCKKYSLQTQYEHGAWYWAKTVVIEIKAAGWNPIRLLDCGTYERHSNHQELWSVIRDAEGQPVTEPVPLNGNGRKLNFGDAPVYREFTAYEKTSFANII
jgi:hypothetical protein